MMVRPVKPFVRSFRALGSESATFGFDAARLFGSSLTANVLAFSVSIIIARILGPDGKGQLAALLVLPGLMAALADLGVKQAGVFLVSSGEVPAGKALSMVLGLWSALLLPGLLIAILAVSVVSEWEVRTAPVVLAALHLPAYIISAYLSGILIGTHHYGSFSRIRVLGPAAFLLAAIILVWWGEMGLTGALVASLVSSIIPPLAATYILHRDYPLRPGFDLPGLRKVLSLGFRYALGLFFVQLILRSDYIVLAKLAPSEELGFYSLATGLVEQAWVLPGILGPLVFSKVSSSLRLSPDEAGGMGREIDSLAKITLLVALVLTTGLALASPFLVRIIYGVAFLDAVPSFFLLIPAVTFFAAFIVLQTHLAGLGKPLLACRALSVPFVLNVGLNLALVPRFGAEAAAISSSLAYPIATAHLAALHTGKNLLGGLFWLAPARSDLSRVKSLIRRR